MIKILSAFFIRRGDLSPVSLMLILPAAKQFRKIAVFNSKKALNPLYKNFHSETHTPPQAAGLLILFSLVLFTASRCACFPEEEIPEEITVISWNVCNLFDSSDNGTEYPEYDPSGDEWNRELYLLRLNNTASVINSIDSRDIILLQEIENLKVAEDLAGGILKKDRLKYTAAADKGDSAVTTAVLSRFPVEEIKNHALESADSSFLRPVFEAKIKIGSRPLYIFNNHWKSKLGGAENTEKERILAASVITRRVSEILAADPDADIVIAGDLNENINEYEAAGKSYQTAVFPESEYSASVSAELLFYTKDSSEAGLKENRHVFYTVWNTPETGSYFYRNRWETIDHFFLNKNLFDDYGFSYCSFRVHTEPFFTGKDGIPFKWENYRQSGYSDHLPVVLKLSLGD